MSDFVGIDVDFVGFGRKIDQLTEKSVIVKIL